MSMQQRISLTLAARDRFSEAFDSASQSSLRLTQAARGTQRELSELGQKTRLVNQYRAVSAQLSETSDQLQSARRRLELLRNGEVEAGVSTREHAQAIRRAERDVQNLNRSYGSQAQRLSALRHNLNSAGINVDALGAEELRLARRTSQANQALEQQQRQLNQVNAIRSRIDARNAQRRQLVGQATGLAVKAAPIVMAGKRAIDYESTFADVKKVVDFSSKEEAAGYRKEMMLLAGQLGVKQEDVAEIVTAAGQSGIEKDQLLKFAENATKMSVAWDVSSAEAGETLATWRAAMGLTQAGALDLANATNYLSNNMNAKAKQIAGVVVRQGSTAMQAGFSSNESAALAAGLIAGGATEETASTAMKNITGALTSGYAATGSQTEAMERLGFNPEELATSMQEDAKGTLVNVLESLQNIKVADRGAVISELFGTEVKGAVSKLVATLDDDTNGLKAAFRRVANEADRANSVNNEYVNRSATRSHKLSQLSSKFDRMVITLGDRLLPVLDVILPPLMSVVDGITNFAEANPQLATGLVGVAAGIAAVKAGAIAFRLARLTLGNGRDRLNLRRTMLSSSTDQTTRSANLASRALDRLNRQLSQLGGRTFGGGGSRRNRPRLNRGRSSLRALRLPAFTASALSSRPAIPVHRHSGRLRSIAALFGQPRSRGVLHGGLTNAATGLAANNAGELASLGNGWDQLNLRRTMLSSSTGQTTRSTNLASRALDRLNHQLSQLGGRTFGGSGSRRNWSRLNRGRSSLRALRLPAFTASALSSRPAIPVHRHSGRLRSIAALFGGAALTNTLFGGNTGEINSTSGMVANEVGLAASSGKFKGAIAGYHPNATGKLRRIVHQTKPAPHSFGSILGKMGKMFRPIEVVMSGTALVDAIANGDAKDIGGTTGNIAGGLGGASAGAMAGAALGSVVPVIGTAVGGLLGSVVGGFSGGELGGWLGEKIGGWFSEDKTEQPAPESVTKKTDQVVNATRSVTFNPTINITPSGDHIYDQNVANDMVKQMKSELTPILMGDSTLDARADANLSDRSDT